jgi:predicted nucleic acid-binding protein
LQQKSRINNYPYLDTNIYIATIKSEKDKSQFCKLIFEKILNNKNKKIIISDLYKEEIKSVCKKKKLNAEISIAYELTFLKNSQKIEITTNKTHTKIAKEISKIFKKRIGENEYNDCLHFILAMESNAKYIITDNISHFEEIKEIYKNKYNKTSIEIISPQLAIENI